MKAVTPDNYSRPDRVRPLTVRSLDIDSLGTARLVTNLTACMVPYLAVKALLILESACNDESYVLHLLHGLTQHDADHLPFNDSTVSGDVKAQAMQWIVHFIMDSLKQHEINLSDEDQQMLCPSGIRSLLRSLTGANGAAARRASIAGHTPGGRSISFARAHHTVRTLRDLAKKVALPKSGIVTDKDGVTAFNDMRHSYSTLWGTLRQVKAQADALEDPTDAPLLIPQIRTVNGKSKPTSTTSAGWSSGKPPRPSTAPGRQGIKDRSKPPSEEARKYSGPVLNAPTQLRAGQSGKAGQGGKDGDTAAPSGPGSDIRLDPSMYKNALEQCLEEHIAPFMKESHEGEHIDRGDFHVFVEQSMPEQIMKEVCTRMSTLGKFDDPEIQRPRRTISFAPARLRKGRVTSGQNAEEPHSEQLCEQPFKEVTKDCLPKRRPASAQPSSPRVPWDNVGDQEASEKVKVYNSQKYGAWYFYPKQWDKIQRRRGKVEVKDSANYLKVGRDPELRSRLLAVEARVNELSRTRNLEEKERFLLKR